MQDMSGVLKGLELPAWGIFAIVLVNMVLTWALKYTDRQAEKKRNGNPGTNMIPKVQCVKTVEWALHDRLQTEMCESMKELVKANTSAVSLLTRIAEANEEEKESLALIAREGKKLI